MKNIFRATAAIMMVSAVSGATDAQRRIGGDQPARFMATESTDGSWQAWLQRTGGGIQPIYYSVMVRDMDRIDARPCVAATATGPNLERRISLSFSGPARLVVRHSLKGDAAGTFHGIRKGCGKIYVQIVDASRPTWR